MFYFKDNKQLTVYFADGNSAVWQADNPQFDRVLELCKSNNWIQIEMLHNQAKILMTSDSTKVEKDGKVSVIKNNKSITLEPTEDNNLLNMIALLKKKGVLDDNITPVKPFITNMLENPYIDAVHEIYEYCKNMDFEITEDGCFLAYKKVRDDLGSVYDNGKTKHKIGEYTEVEKFDTDRSRECSYGLHFCSKQYLNSYGGEVVILVKVNPKDVVSIPKDYNFAKGRCKRYLTVGIIAKDGTLQTTNLEEATGEKIVKTKAKAKADKKLAHKEANANKGIGRIQETVQNMKIYNNDVNKVASIMNISVETVRRNLRKFKQNKRETS